MHENTDRILTRDVEVIRIPSGEIFTLTAGTAVVITQALGGSFTIWTPEGLARVADENADALGMEATIKKDEAASGPAPKVEEQTVWDQLRTCYDPEIPVNIVDLGLVYSMDITKQDDGGHRVDVQMTLTAPGCGMGPVLAEDAKGRILLVPGVSAADVRITWEPPWNQSMISEEGKMKLGLI